MWKRRKKTERELYNEKLLEEIDLTKIELESAYSYFENAIDPDLIESCIYRIDSIQKRYRYLLNQLKNNQQKESTL